MRGNKSGERERQRLRERAENRKEIRMARKMKGRHEKEGRGGGRGHDKRKRRAKRWRKGSVKQMKVRCSSLKGHSPSQFSSTWLFLSIVMVSRHSELTT